MEQFLGKDYTFESQEGFDAYLEHLGLGYVKRKMAITIRPTQTLYRNENGTYKLVTRAPLLSMESVFTPGVEFEETTPDGTKVKALITFEGNVMTHRQTDDEGRKSKHVVVFSQEEIVVTTTVEGSNLIAKRVFKLVQK